MEDINGVLSVTKKEYYDRLAIVMSDLKITITVSYKDKYVSAKTTVKNMDELGMILEKPYDILIKAMLPKLLFDRDSVLIGV